MLLYRCLESERKRYCQHGIKNHPQNKSTFQKTNQ